MPQITPFARAALIEFLGLCSSPGHTSAAPTRRAPPTPAAPRRGPTGGGGRRWGGGAGKSPTDLPWAAGRDRTGRFVPFSAAPLLDGARPVPSGRRTRVRGAPPAGAGPSRLPGLLGGLLDKGRSGGARRGRRDAQRTEGGTRDAPHSRSAARLPVPDGRPPPRAERAAENGTRRPPTARCDIARHRGAPRHTGPCPGGSLRPAPRRFPPCALPPASPRERPRAAAPFVSPALPPLAAVPLPLLSPVPPPLCAHTPKGPPRGSQRCTARPGTLRARCAPGGRRGFAPPEPRGTTQSRPAGLREESAARAGTGYGTVHSEPARVTAMGCRGGAAPPQVSIGPGPTPPTTPVPKETERRHRGNNNLFK